MRLTMNSMKMLLSCFAVAALLGTPALAKPPVHHDHPQRPPLLSTFNGVSPPGGRIGPDSDPSIRTEILRDIPDANVFN
jgi:hypothetical protein